MPFDCLHEKFFFWDSKCWVLFMSLMNIYTLKVSVLSPRQNWMEIFFTLDSYFIECHISRNNTFILTQNYIVKILQNKVYLILWVWSMEKRVLIFGACLEVLPKWFKRRKEMQEWKVSILRFKVQHIVSPFSRILATFPAGTLEYTIGSDATWHCKVPSCHCVSLQKNQWVAFLHSQAVAPRCAHSFINSTNWYQPVPVCVFSFPWSMRPLAE